MSDLVGWIGLGVTIIAAAIGLVTYLRRHRVKRLSYLVLRKDRLGPRSSYFPLDVSFAGEPVLDPTISVTRILNSGEEPLTADDFEVPLNFDVGDTAAVRAFAIVSRRPPDLEPKLVLNREGHVSVEPLLLNSGDMFEVQLLTSGAPREITLTGRVKGVTTIDRVRQLPYPPGSGREGEMNLMDKFVWFGMAPSLAILLSYAFPGVYLAEAGASSALAYTATVVVALAVLTVYFLNLRRLVRKRRMWRP